MRLALAASATAAMICRSTRSGGPGRCECCQLQKLFCLPERQSIPRYRDGRISALRLGKPKGTLSCRWHVVAAVRTVELILSDVTSTFGGDSGRGRQMRSSGHDLPSCIGSRLEQHGPLFEVVRKHWEQGVTRAVDPQRHRRSVTFVPLETSAIYSDAGIEGGVTCLLPLTGKADSSRGIP